MTTIKSYTDIEQSKKLAKILPIESADMVYIASANDDDDGGPLYTAEYKSEIIIQEDDENIHCWSLAALLDVLPNNQGRYTKSLYWFDGVLHCEYVDVDGAGILDTSADNTIDACYGMILKLHESKKK